MIDNERYLLVGGSGLLGSYVNKELVSLNKNTFCLSRTKKKDIENYIQFDLLSDKILNCVNYLTAQDTVILLAAYSDQNWIRNNPNLSYELNVTCSLRLIEEIIPTGCHFVFISSGAVFGTDCPESEGWKENSVTSPSSEYGRQKELAEQQIKNLANTCIVRTGWNTGWGIDSRCVIKQTYQDLLGGNAKIATDNFLTITDAKDTAKGVSTIAVTKFSGIAHLVNAPISRKQLADIIIATSKFGSQMKYNEVSFKELGLPEDPPARSYLAADSTTEKLGLGYKEAEEVIQEKVALLDNFKTS